MRTDGQCNKRHGNPQQKPRETIDIKITGTEMKNAFDRFISKSDMTEEKTSTLRFSQ